MKQLQLILYKISDHIVVVSSLSFLYFPSYFEILLSNPLASNNLSEHMRESFATCKTRKKTIHTMFDKKHKLKLHLIVMISIFLHNSKTKTV